MSLNRIFNKIKSIFNRDISRSSDLKRFQGYLNGENAFIGPKTVQVDLTDYCKNSCLLCWTHSPLIKNSQTLKQLSFERVSSLVKELKTLGVEEIHLAGAGDPLCYPNLEKILFLLKKEGFKINLNTSMLPFKMEWAKLFVDLELDLITLSLWAGDEGTWQRVHPGQRNDLFMSIEKFLIELVRLKAKTGKGKPKVKIFNVIFSENEHSIRQMVEFARKCSVQELEFQIPDLWDPTVEKLAVTKEGRLSILEAFQGVRESKYFIHECIGPNNKLDLSKNDIRNEQKEFGRLLHDLPQDFELERKDGVLVVTCPEGKQSQKLIWAQGHPFPEFSWEFDSFICSSCKQKGACYRKNSTWPLQVGMVNLVGLGSFLRRLRVKEEVFCGEDNDGSALQFCNIGWHYLRIASNGDVYPCCKGSSHPLGNIYKHSLRDIWFSKAYNHFRRSFSSGVDENALAKKIGCLRGCDNLGMNMSFQNSVEKHHILRKN